MTKPITKTVEEILDMLEVGKNVIPSSTFMTTDQPHTHYYIKGKKRATKQIEALILDGKIEELERLNTRRHYGKDYQDSLDELDDYKDKRIAELKEQKNG